MAERASLVWMTVVCVSVPGLSTVHAMQDGYEPRGPNNFVNWETPHVHPITMTPDGGRLLAVNLGDARLEVFTLASGSPRWVGSVAVGIDPASVRARTTTEAWVVNTISDTISIVDLSTMRVVRTIATQDEPRDVVFAGGRAFVTCALPGVVQVYDLSNLAAAPTNVSLLMEDPRALAVSTDGTTVYAASFTSGNRSTILGGGSSAAGGMRLAFPPNVVSDPAGPYGGVNPPPNSGASFNPPINPGIGTPPRVGLIVKKNAAGRWMDDNNGDWTNLVSGPQAALSGRPIGWDIYDHDLAAINVGTLSVSYATGLMNIGMAMGVNPATGAITVVGTDATNEIRFEPNINGTFVRVKMASVSANNLGQKTIVDLNPHLTYTTPTLASQSERDRAIGDPRGIVWNAAGTKAYVSGMGSNNVVVINASGARAGLSETIEVGEGPTGMALDEARSQLYVLNKFAGSITVVNTTTETVTRTVGFFDPTPSAIKVGRKHLYDTHKNSGLGQVACASCHVDGKMDKLAWDLGDPSGGMQSLVDLNLGFNFPGLSPGSANPTFQPFSPMKGPMTTQTMQDIIGKEPHHWRGDRFGIEAFAPAFMGLQGDDTTLTATEMQEFEDFLATIHFPPNPYRNLDNSLPTNLPLPGHYRTGRFGAAGTPLPNGNAVQGLAIYRPARRLDANAFACVTCHTLPTGAGPDYALVGTTLQPIPPGPLGQRHLAVVSVDGSTNITMKIPQTRNVPQKSGFNATQVFNTSGFGFLHDGSVDSIERFVGEPVFTVASDQEVANLTAFMLAFSGSDLPAGSTNGTALEPPGVASKDAHAAVGKQITVISQATLTTAEQAMLNTLVAQANANRIGLIAKGRQGGIPRGYALTSTSTFQSDRTGETRTYAQLLAAAAPGSEITFTAVPKNSEIRMGIDRDVDGAYDRDELDHCGDPENPLVQSGTCPCPADVDDGTGTGTPDGGVTIDDLLYYLGLFEAGVAGADLDDGSGTGTPDGGVTIDDLLYYLARFEAGC